MEKALFRKKMLKIRKGLNPREIEKKSRKIIEKLTKLSKIKSTKNILVYLSLKDEVNTALIIEKWHTGKELIAPRINPVSHTLELRKLIPKSTKKNIYGIHEPKINQSRYLPSKIDIALIPGVAFDIQGNRLGFGKGYYDKLLKELTCPIIGLAFECQIVKQLPIDAHDHPVDMIITEKRIIRPKK